jgi:hypothetical protein
MGKMKQCPLATLLIIIVLVIPSIADAAEPNTHIGSGYSALDSSFLRCDLSQNVTCEYLAANDNKEGSSPSFTRTLVDRLHDAGNSDADSSRSSHSPRWTVSVEAIIFERIGTANRTLVERVPGIVSFADVQTTPGIPALNSTDLETIKIVGCARIPERGECSRGWFTPKLFNPCDIEKIVIRIEFP